MIDIETLDILDTAVVYQVGILIFKGAKVVDKKLINMDVKEQLRAQRTISSDTMRFHLEGDHSLDMLNALADNTTYSIEGLQNALQFYGVTSDIDIWWSKGNFDFPILNSLLGGNVPWKFYQLGELRTLMKACNIPKTKTAHTALADCEEQFKALKKCRAIIRKGLK